MGWLVCSVQVVQIKSQFWTRSLICTSVSWHLFEKCPYTTSAFIAVWGIAILLRCYPS